MLAISLERSCDGVDTRIGPVDALRIVGASLRILPLNVELLHLNGDQWSGDNERFTGLVVETPTLVYLERSRRSKGRFCGPFEYIRIVHAAIYSSIDHRQTLARFNPIDGDWHICDDQTNWPTLLLFPCCPTAR